MARNEEKAQAMLNKFVAAKKEANRPDKSQRPYLASECNNVSDCEIYRNQIIKEISKKVSLIQNEGLDEHKVRDLNDAINKLMREKGHWERQIKSLGGPDYFRTAPKLIDDEDAEEVVPGKGYRYYGAAKKLPGVRELFSKPPADRQKRTRHEMMKGVDADYYGYRDDDDGVLVKLESQAQAEMLQRAQEEWELKRQTQQDGDADADQLADEGEVGRLVGLDDSNVRSLCSMEWSDQDPCSSTSLSLQEGAGTDGVGMVAHVQVPDQDAIKRAVLARRKQELLAKLNAGDGAKLVSDDIETAEPARLPPSW